MNEDEIFDSRPDLKILTVFMSGNWLNQLHWLSSWLYPKAIIGCHFFSLPTFKHMSRPKLEKKSRNIYFKRNQKWIELSVYRNVKLKTNSMNWLLLGTELFSNGKTLINNK